MVPASLGDPGWILEALDEATLEVALGLEEACCSPPLVYRLSQAVSWAGGSLQGPCLEGPFARKMGDVEPRDPLLSLTCSLLPGASCAPRSPLAFLVGKRLVSRGEDFCQAGPALPASVAHLGKGIQLQISERSR